MPTNTYEAIFTETLASAAATVTFSSIPSTYTDLVLIFNGGKSIAGSSVDFRFNSDTGSNYSFTEIYGNGTTAASQRVSNRTYGALAFNAVPDSGLTSTIIMNIMNYSNTTTNKTAISRNGSIGTSFPGTEAIVNLWRSTAAINTITLSNSGAATFSIGSTFSLYGIAAA
jgi:hypothetical protein